MTFKTLQEALDWFASRKPTREPLFDFNRPIGHPCAKCGYPTMTGQLGYPINWLDCPEHRPGHFKYFDRAQKIIKETLHETT